MARYIDGIKVSSNVKDLSGGVYGMLTVTHLAGRRQIGKSKYIVWGCICECGKETEVVSQKLISGHTRSCGCLQIETARKMLLKHGWNSTKEYKAWQRVKSRTLSPSNPDYAVYSVLGISENFANDFTKFLEDIGPIPNDMEGVVSVDRIDNSIGYFEGNVRWATQSQQARNKGMKSGNKSGVTGVRNHNERHWAASWCDLDGKRRIKYFSIEKYGDELSFLMACEYRQHQIDLLNLAGAGYTENHGK